MSEPTIISNPLVDFYQDSRGTYTVMKSNRKDEKPVIAVFTETLPQAYELMLKSLWENGNDVRTHYDRKDSSGNYVDPPSREATVFVNIDQPFKEPRIHKILPGNYDSLENYRQEVVDGIHDAWIDPRDENGEKSSKWTYTYHERLFNYNPSTDLYAEDRGLLLPNGVNQIEKVIEDLTRDITSKGAQATTWMPTADPGLESNRPCLQRMWFRAYEDDNGEVGLNTDWFFRSRDVKAWFMNFWALSDLAREVGSGLEKSIGMKVNMRRITDGSDSLHFYGSYFTEFETKHYVKVISDEGFEKRVAPTDHQGVQYSFEEERGKIARNPHYNMNEESQKTLAVKISRDKDASERDKAFVKTIVYGNRDTAKERLKDPELSAAEQRFLLHFYPEIQ